jgi:mono/diheme cytochrome c family protein
LEESRESFLHARTMIKRLIPIAAAFAVVAAQAQTQPPPARPGPMQSGQHATQAAAAQTAATGASAPAAPAPAAPAPAGAEPDAKQLFATVCGWCHSSGGREAGKGPKLMGSTLSDGELIHRIKVGKVGQMPGFASSLNDKQLAGIVTYIRNLKPEGQP